MKLWIKILLGILMVIIAILIFDYFSGSFNLVFFPEKSSGVMIYGNPIIEDKIKLG